MEYKICLIRALYIYIYFRWKFYYENILIIYDKFIYKKICKKNYQILVNINNQLKFIKLNYWFFNSFLLKI